MGTARTTFVVERCGGATERGPDQTRKYVLCMPSFSLRFFLLTIVVVHSGVPLGVRMRNRKLHTIYPSGAFLPEVPPWSAC
jgi:hypothetical protein